MKYLVSLAAVGLLVLPAMADQTLSYSWEDGVGTILGSYGNLVDPTNVTGPQTGLKGDVPPLTWTCPGAYDGDRYLHVAEEPHDGTPQAYVAWITGLNVGDMVDASIWAWDDESVDSYPSSRIWAHYATDDIETYQGSAGEGLNNSGYTTGIGWEEMSSSWEFGTPAGYGAETSLVIEFRLYSSPSTSTEYRTDYWADLVTVTAPATAPLHFAPEPTSLGLMVIGAVAALRRRR